MKSIAVTKPDMAVLKTGGTGLSPFGMLSALFGQEVLRRSRYGPGNYRPTPLELLEEEPASVVQPAPEVKLDLDLTLIIKALKEEQKKEREQDRRETAQAAQRVLERVLRREEKLRAQETTWYIILQSGLTTRAGTAGSAGQRRSGLPGTAIYGGQSRRTFVYGGQKNIAVSRVDSVLMGQLSHGGLEPVSSCTAAPATGGWKPQWQQSHPGFAPKGENTEFYSILLPDVLRCRRAEFLQELTEEKNMFRQTGRDGAEHVDLKAPVSRERLAREVSLAVGQALQKQRNMGRAQPSGKQWGDHSRMEGQSGETDVPESESQDILRDKKEDKRAGQKAEALSIEHTGQEKDRKKPRNMEFVRKESTAAGDMGGLPSASEPGVELIFRSEEGAGASETARPDFRAAETSEKTPHREDTGGEGVRPASAEKKEERHSLVRRPDPPDGETRQFPEKDVFRRERDADERHAAVPAAEAERAELAADEVLAYRGEETRLPDGRRPEAADGGPREESLRLSEAAGLAARTGEDRPGGVGAKYDERAPGREGEPLPSGAGKPPAGPDGISRQESFEFRPDEAGAVQIVQQSGRSGEATQPGRAAAPDVPEEGTTDEDLAKAAPIAQAVPVQEHEGKEKTDFLVELVDREVEAAAARQSGEAGGTVRPEQAESSGTVQILHQSGEAAWPERTGSPDAVQIVQQSGRSGEGTQPGRAAASDVPEEGTTDEDLAKATPIAQAVPVQEHKGKEKTDFLVELVDREVEAAAARQSGEAGGTTRPEQAESSGTVQILHQSGEAAWPERTGSPDAVQIVQQSGRSGEATQPGRAAASDVPEEGTTDEEMAKAAPIAQAVPVQEHKGKEKTDFLVELVDREAEAAAARQSGEADGTTRPEQAESSGTVQILHQSGEAAWPERTGSPDAVQIVQQSGRSGEATQPGRAAASNVPEEGTTDEDLAKAAPIAQAVPVQEHRGKEKTDFLVELVDREVEAAAARQSGEAGGTVRPEQAESSDAVQIGHRSGRAAQWEHARSPEAVRTEIIRQSGGPGRAPKEGRSISRPDETGAVTPAVPAEGTAEKNAAGIPPTAQAVPGQGSFTEDGDAFQQSLIYREERDPRTEERSQGGETEREPQEMGRPVVTPAQPGHGESSRPAPQALPAGTRSIGEASSGELVYSEWDAEQGKEAVPGQRGDASFGQRVQLVYSERSAGTQQPPDPERQIGLLAVPLRSGVREIQILNSRGGRSDSSPLRGPASGERTVELSYLSPPAAGRESGEDGDLKELPPWAQRLMEYPDAAAGPRPGGTVSFGQTAGGGGTPAGQPGQPPGAGTGRQIRWSAPNGTVTPANLSYREPKPAETVQTGPAPMGERELRRTADKVYRMIEERLRRELRRSGR